MKKNILISIIIAVALFNINSTRLGHNRAFLIPNNQGNDTNKYLQDHIISRKADFQGKDLTYLLAAMDVKVKSYRPIRGDRPGAPYRCIILHFENVVVTDNKIGQLKPVPFLTVFFENELPGNKAMGLYVQSNGNWTQAEADYYGKMKIKDIVGAKQ